MDALNSSRYFSDPAVAKFVDQVQAGDVARVKQALAAGISPNAEGADGFRPIHFVFVAPKADVLRELLSAGADPNARLANGNPPLEFAVRMANPDFTAALLAAKADPNARGENNAPVIHTAITYPTVRNVELLVKAGADINVVWGGNSPLMAAVTAFKWEMAAVLLKLNADPAWTNDIGKGAVERFCRHLNGLPATSKNKAGTSALVDAFAARGVVLPCATDAARFR